MCVCVCINNYLAYVYCPDYALRTFISLIKENGFILRKATSRRYPV